MGLATPNPYGTPRSHALRGNADWTLRVLLGAERRKTTFHAERGTRSDFSQLFPQNENRAKSPCFALLGTMGKEQVGAAGGA